MSWATLTQPVVWITPSQWSHRHSYQELSRIDRNSDHHLLYKFSLIQAFRSLVPTTWIPGVWSDSSDYGHRWKQAGPSKLVHFACCSHFFSIGRIIKQNERMSRLDKDAINCAGLQVEMANELCLASPWDKLNQKYKSEGDMRFQAFTSSMGKIYSVLTNAFSLQNSMAFKVVKMFHIRSYILSIDCHSSGPHTVHLMGMILFQPNISVFFARENSSHSSSDIRW